MSFQNRIVNPWAECAFPKSWQRYAGLTSKVPKNRMTFPDRMRLCKPSDCAKNCTALARPLLES